MRKSTIIMILFMLAAVTLHAQNETDALRYGQLFRTGGTARSLSMGNAFGALGGDMGALSINPAGIGVFRRGAFSFSPSYLFDKTSADYLGETRSEFENKLSIGNVGFVSTYNTGRDKGWVSMSFGATYNKETNYSKQIQIAARNNNGSYLNYFANMADGWNITDLYAYEEALAYNVYLIDTVNGDPYDYETILSEYGDMANSTYGEMQRRTISRSGYSSEYLFTFGANFSYNFYLGGSLSIQSLRYKRTFTHNETDDQGTIYEFDYFRFNDNLETVGTGMGLKLGFIYKPVKILRIGGAVHFPVVYRLRDNYYTTIEAGYDFADSQGNTVYNDQSPDGNYTYRLSTPLHAILSGALVFGKLGLVSLDYEYVDYSNLRLRNGEDGYDFADKNDAIQSAYTSVHNLRAGAEIRLGTLSVRGGAMYSSSPYRSSELNKDAFTMSYSAGLGFKDRNLSLDLGYVFTAHKENYVLYPNPQGNYAALSSARHNVIATIAFRF
ncbi:MAG: hypothetical protein GXO83_09000 [Chlorobi bacterium]|nr:hypothetical protein [Chlorobiota bacterium]